MCFSAAASYGVAAVVLPAGAYCAEAAWRKDRRFLLLAAVPVLFGLQQLGEAQVWDGLERGDGERVRVGSLGFLFFALAVWPVWMPLSVAAVERRWRRWTGVALAGSGVAFAAAYYLPVHEFGHGLNPVVVGHSLRYDFSQVPAVNSPVWWVGPAVYLAAVAVLCLLSSRKHLRQLGVMIVVLAVALYALFAHAFASVWCFFAAILSVYLAFVMGCLPSRVALASAAVNTPPVHP
jgi:hypothetical protein